MYLIYIYNISIIYIYIYKRQGNNNQQLNLLRKVSRYYNPEVNMNDEWCLYNSNYLYYRWCASIEIEQLIINCLLYSWLKGNSCQAGILIF